MSRRYGLKGKPDAIVRTPSGDLIPVERKRGTAPRRPYDGDLIQAAAYCVLIEEHYGQAPSFMRIQYADRWFDEPYIGPPTRTAAPGGGDGGWDVVVVNNFADQDFSRIIVLGHCATGRDDWHKKGMEAQPSFFWDSFTKAPQPYNVCLTFLTVPFLMTRDEKLRKAAPTCLAFDRIRVCENAPETSAAAMQWLDTQRTSALNLAIV